jgi:AcrR family transcriptional regulator
MVRNAEDTKRRILAAATEEFTGHGIAGARVDRIAAAANSNKAMLYAYFGNKEQLFEAVFAQMVTAATDAVPFDACDLPAYAVAMFERYRADPGVGRLSDWYRLEHGKPGPDDAVSAVQRGRLAAIAQAQRDKVISDRLQPQELFSVITALTRMGTPEFTRLNPPSSPAAARAVVYDIVQQLVQPDRQVPAGHQGQSAAARRG